MSSPPPLVITALAERPRAHSERVEKLIIEAAVHYGNADSKDYLARDHEIKAHDHEDAAKELRIDARAEREKAIAIVTQLRALGLT